MTSINAAIVSSVITALRWILQLIQVLLSAYDKLPTLLISSPTAKQDPSKTVVIVGGNFAGLAALWELLSKRSTSNNLRIILIDQRPYFEYTPGILRLFCQPDAFYNVVQPLPASNTYPNFQFYQGKVTSLVDRNNNKILTYLPTSNTPPSTQQQQQPRQLRYDYIIVATGATYPAPISPRLQENIMTMENRFREWQVAHQHLDRARNVLILGAGAVGVELAAEIVDHYHSNEQHLQPKQVTLLDAQSSLVPNFPKAVGEYAQQWLERRGVTVRLGETWQSWTDTTCTLQDGTILKADVVYVCFGSKPNSELVKAPAQQHEPYVHAQPWCSLTQRQTIRAQSNLQVLPATITTAAAAKDVASSDSTRVTTSVLSHHIFVCGDVATPTSHDEKQAFQAEMQGKVAARNVLHLASRSSSVTSSDTTQWLYRYPNDIAGSPHMPLIFVLSLGKYDGVLGFNDLIIPGPLAAIVKWVLEYTKVLQMRGDLLGKLIWKLGDAIVLFLSRTLILPSQSSTTTWSEPKRLKAV
jgi:NADH dehydrogenase FAD-containing subunit